VPFANASRMMNRDDGDDVYNATPNRGGGMLPFSGPPTAFDRNSSGVFSTPDSPSMDSWGIANQPVRPSDVVQSMQQEQLDKMHQQALGALTQAARRR
jgi:hypothetical protein